MGGESRDWFWESGLWLFYTTLAFSDLLLPGVVPEVQAQLPLSMPQEALLVVAAVAGGGLQTIPPGTIGAAVAKRAAVGVYNYSPGRRTQPSAETNFLPSFSLQHGRTH